MPSDIQRPYLKKTCEHCKIGHYIETPDGGDWWLTCVECRALLFCYNPMPHQAQFHSDSHKYKAFFGG